MAQFLLLVTGDHGPGQSAVAIPATRLRARVTTGHPPQELAVVDDELGVRELMRVEHERRNTQRQHGEPEVDKVWRPDSHRGIKQEEDVPHSHVDARTSEAGIENGE